MKFIETLKNYLFSSNLNLINPYYRFAPVFYKRFILDVILRLFIFIPYCIAYLFTIKQGLFNETITTLQENNQNGYGYLLVTFYIYVSLVFSVSLIASLIGSVLKLKLKLNSDNNEYSKNYSQAILNSWKNLWYLTFETLVILILSFVFMSFAPSAKGVAMNFTAMMFIKSIVITASSSLSLAVLVSLPFLRKKEIPQTPQEVNVA